MVQSPGTLTVSNKFKTVYSVGIFIGLVLFVGTLLKNAERAWFSYLTSYFYFVSLGLGGLFFTAIQHVTRAGWSVNVRRLAEAMTAFLPFAALGGVVLVFGAPHLYEWLQPEVVANDPLIQHKTAYLNQPFFIIRLALFLGLWLLFAKILVGRSLSQDAKPNDSLSEKSVGTSIAFLLIFALSYSFFSIDTLMSLEPHWFSTIFGVYCFAGLFQSSIAVMILLAAYLLKTGKLKGFVDENHLHDLGKFMFAFTVFWAYIAFSQYMLIWYANLPEETFFYLPRLAPGWFGVSAALLICKFVVPFLALLSRRAKRNVTYLSAVAIWVLIMQYVDLYWLVYPNFNEEHVTFGLPEIGSFMLFGGLFLLSVTRFLSRHSVVAVGDPRIHESMHHHVTY